MQVPPTVPLALGATGLVPRSTRKALRQLGVAKDRVDTLLRRLSSLSVTYLHRMIVTKRQLDAQLAH